MLKSIVCFFSSSDALDHPFFSRNSLKPTLADFVLLPSSVLRLMDIVDQNDDASERQGNAIKAISFGKALGGKIFSTIVQIVIIKISEVQQVICQLCSSLIEGRSGG